MAVKYRDTDYMYSSARVRALEVRLAAKENIERMLDAPSASDVIATLVDYGFEIARETDDPSSAVLREETLTSLLASSYEEMRRMCDGMSVVDFLRYPYDCNNFKSVIKCRARGIDPAPLLTNAASVSIKDTLDSFESGDFSILPPAMAAAVPMAEEAFSMSGNPQQVDFHLDRACFADMLANARQYGIPLAEKLVRTKIDLVNIMSCVRILRMKLGAMAEPLFEDTVIEGGYLDTGLLREAIGTDEAKFADMLKYNDEYYMLAQYIGTGTSLAEIEKQMDDAWMRIAKTAKQTPFGAPVLIGYMMAIEYEVKNIRIILAGKDARLAPEVIRERLRENYV